VLLVQVVDTIAADAAAASALVAAAPAGSAQMLHFWLDQLLAGVLLLQHLQALLLQPWQLNQLLPSLSGLALLLQMDLLVRQLLNLWLVVLAAASVASKHP
jgi:hypothetical protein